MILKDYIKQNYDGNVAAFARDMKKHPPTVHRWIKAGALIIEGDVYILTAKRPD